ncbi:hybrid sensor histidine kinase/response regulator transcription factor [Flavivirga eckloniae]|uniref:histidine kinase n=1 Tax=Flavivirga eckloniae TaxID=1803846 RepID=A0A2K9PRS1_9FLAO|nr:hybrid sensor histidine kinase/response regulator transcription factor [Flavivirga eckloniae]AUP79762.1 hybrid sensor histidine kinase/response regulator [Flavivirga eckloniae]
MLLCLRFRLLICIFLCIHTIHGQEIDFNNLTFVNLREGIPQMPISTIIEDNSGFIWIGTRGAGLYRFDGENYYAYSYDVSNKSSIDSNLIYCAFLDSDNNLWVGTNVGLNRYNRDLDSFERVDFKSNISSLNVSVKSLIEDSEKNLIIATYGKGMLKMSIQTNDISKIILEADTKNSLFINSLSKSNKGVIYVGTNMGLRILDDDTLKKVIIDNKDYSKVFDTYVETLSFDDNDNLWVGTHVKGIYKISSISDKPQVDIMPVSDKRILSLKTFKDRVLVGTENDGLLVIDAQGRILKTYLNSLYDSKSLSSNSVWTLFIDKQYRLWVGYYNRGVSVHDNLYSKFGYIENLPNNKNSLQGQSVSGIKQDRKGRYWIAVNSGLDILDPKTNTFDHVNEDAASTYKGLKTKAVETVFIDSKENVWVGTWDKAIYYLKKGSKSFVNYNKETTNGAITSDGIMSFAEDSKGKIWIASFLKGLHYYDPVKKAFFHCSSKPFVDNDLINSDVKVVMVDNSDTIWMGTTSGLFQVKLLENGTFEVISMRNTISKITKNHPSIHDILSLYQSSDNRIWVGTKGGGLFAYNKETKAFKSYNDLEGFNETSVNTIIEGDDGSLWISGISGITNINFEKQKARNYTVDDGLLDNYFNNGAVLKNENGELYFGGYLGINYFNPKNIKTNNSPPKLYLSSLKLFNKEVGINDKESPLKKVISQTDKITLNHNQSVFTLSYGSINYTHPEKNQYAYKLEGFDQNWNYVGNTKNATYTNLPHGDYIFKLKSANNDGVWNIKPLELNISVLPPWWKTRTWYVLMTLFALISLLAVSQFLRLRFKQRQLIQFEREKRLQEELLNKKKLQFFTNISHEFRTPLTLIINPLEDIIKNSTLQLPEIVKHKHKVIRKNADRLSRLINELMDFRKLQLNKILVQAQEIDIINKVKNVLAYFEEEARHRQIDITFETSIGSLKTWIDPGMLEKILFNILSNAFKMTPDKGEITILIRIREIAEAKGIELSNAFDISIKDTGPGLDQKEYKNIFKRFYQVGKKNKDYYGSTGIGLEMVKSFTELNKGKIDVTSELGKGTTFTVTFPIGKSQYTEEEILPTTSQNGTIEDNFVNSNGEQTENTIANREEYALVKKEHSLLIVEDNIELRDYLKNELKSKYNILTAENGEKGFEIAEKETPNLILTDVVMPILDGYELCKKIKTNVKTSHIPLLMLTSKAMTEEKIIGIDSGADAYLSKPFDMGVLKSTLTQLLTSRQLLFDKYTAGFVMSAANTATTPLDKTFIEKVLDYIGDNISNTNLGVEILASEFHLSRSQFYRKIKALTGISANELIRKVRLEKAKQLLETGSYNVNEVTYKIGFSSASYFTKCFKVEYGHLPTETKK